MMKKTFIVGIAGISGSGKTTLTRALKKFLRNIKIVQIDKYWKERTSIPKSFDKWREWERPSSINFRKLYKDLVELKNKNLYNTIIVEGFNLFYNKKIRGIIDLKIYLNIPSSLVVKRRLQKFGHGEGQERYSKEIVVKEYKKYGKPTKKYADLKFSGTSSVNEIAKKIKKALLKRAV